MLGGARGRLGVPSGATWAPFGHLWGALRQAVGTNYKTGCAKAMGFLEIMIFHCLLAIFQICCGECVNQRSGVVDGRLTAMFDMLIVSCGLLSIALGAKDVPKCEMLIFHVLYNVSRASNSEGRSFVARVKGDVLGGVKKGKPFPRIWGLSPCK